MYSSQIAQQVRKFIVDNYQMGQDNGLKNTDSFLDAGVIDSTGVLELIAYLQEMHGITVEDEEVTTDNLDSIDKVSAYLIRKLSTEEASMREDAVQEA